MQCMCQFLFLILFTVSVFVDWNHIASARVDTGHWSDPICPLPVVPSQPSHTALFPPLASSREHKRPSSPPQWRRFSVSCFTCIRPTGSASVAGHWRRRWGQPASSMSCLALITSRVHKLPINYRSISRLTLWIIFLQLRSLHRNMYNKRLQRLQKINAFVIFINVYYCTISHIKCRKIFVVWTWDWLTQISNPSLFQAISPLNTENIQEIYRL